MVYFTLIISNLIFKRQIVNQFKSLPQKKEAGIYKNNV